MKYVEVLRSGIRAFDLFFFAYWAVVSTLTFLCRDGISSWTGILFKNAILLCAVWVFIWQGERPASTVLRFCRFWYPCAAFPILFTELSYSIHLIRPVDSDPLLIRLDYFLFGVHPTIWLERFVHPVLTEILQIFYVLYFFLPLPLGFLLYFGKKDDSFYIFATSVSMLLFLSLLGYLAVPAIGPRFTLAPYHQVPLNGIWSANYLMDLLNRLEGVNRDCFPSGHTAMAVLVCLESYRHSRSFFLAYVVVGIGVFLGTIYLRYHYMVDLPAGMLLAVVCSVASRRMVPWWERVIRTGPRQKGVIALHTGDPCSGTEKHREGCMMSAEKRLLHTNPRESDS